MTTRGGAHICQTPTGAGVVVASTPEHSHVSGIARCGSSWACPVCAPVIREHRAREIDDALTQHLTDGGGAYFLTLTLRHHAGDKLGRLIGLLSDLWRRTQQRKVWRHARLELGVIGSIRALETTWSPEHGWHPHLHILVFTERVLPEGDEELLRGDLFTAWSDLVAQASGRYTSPRGVDLRRATSGSIGSYFTKLAGAGWSIGREIARTDRKKGLTPFGILQLALEDGDAEMLELWLQYERATLGRSSVRWSRGLRARFVPPAAVDLTDDDLATEDAVSDDIPRVEIPADVWARALNAGMEWELLELLEDWAAAGYSGDPPVGTVLDPDRLRRIRRNRLQLPQLVA